MALQFRRGTDAERQQFEFAEGEPVYVTDTGELYIGDGETQGGRRVLSSLSEESDPELGGNLDLNDNNIVGIGNIAIDGNLSVSGLGQSLDLNDYNIIGRGSINIDGTITATGDINLGDGAEDNVIVGGQISSPLTPAEDGLYDLGSDSLRWRNGYFEGLEVDGEINANSVVTDIIINNDSSVLYNGTTQSLSALSVDANTFSGDLFGSVFGEDSTTIIDATNNTINTTRMTIRNSSLILNDTFELDLVGAKVIAQEWYGIDNNLISAARFSQSSARGTVENPSPVQVGDYVSGISANALSNDGTTIKSAIATSIDAVTGSNDLPGKLEILIEDYEGELSTPFSINSRGTVFGQTFKTGSYADETERDSLIPNPEAGMIIFLSGHDDSSGSPKFQGYNGTNWVDFF